MPRTRIIVTALALQAGVLRLATASAADVKAGCNDADFPLCKLINSIDLKASDSFAKVEGAPVFDKSVLKWHLLDEYGFKPILDKNALPDQKSASNPAPNAKGDPAPKPSEPCMIVAANGAQNYFECDFSGKSDSTAGDAKSSDSTSGAAKQKAKKTTDLAVVLFNKVQLAMTALGFQFDPSRSGRATRVYSRSQGRVRVSVNSSSVCVEVFSSTPI